ncbi:MAG: hypothetical protein ACFB14_06665 [Leptolyngbyaceae cyanobacterium]
MSLNSREPFQGAVYNPAYPGELEAIFRNDYSDDGLLHQLLPVLGSLLKCDCCFLYLRHPHRHHSRVTHYWAASDRYPSLVEANWHPESKQLLESPLFSAAIAAENSVFIDNVEAEYTGLREMDSLVREEYSLAQGHVLKENHLWGVIRVCVFERSRTWMQFDRSLVMHSVQRLLPSVINYVEAASP